MHETILADLKKAYLGRSDRLNHVYGVKNTAIKLAKIHGVDINKVITAAYLHDLTKYMDYDKQVELLKAHNLENLIDSFSPPLYHAFTAAIIAKTVYNIHDIDLLNAITSHTVGKSNMSILEKIIFISDYIEPSRHYASCVMVREIAFNDLDYAIYLAIDYSIKYFESIGGRIPSVAIDARNFYNPKGGFHE
ncbi:MAG: bis(5'-nucleosyl)-tetraphosphatase (symmetrical) YqeK [Candidatus Izemoplasmataceae bacterium]